MKKAHFGGYKPLISAKHKRSRIANPSLFETLRRFPFPSFPTMPATALRASAFVSIAFAIVTAMPLPSAHAGLPDTNAIMEEIQNFIHEADLLRSKGELAAAASNYRSALEMIPKTIKFGAFRASVAERYAAASVAHAKALADGGQYAEANRTARCCPRSRLRADLCPGARAQREAPGR